MGCGDCRLLGRLPASQRLEPRRRRLPPDEPTINPLTPSRQSIVTNRNNPTPFPQIAGIGRDTPGAAGCPSSAFPSSRDAAGTDGNREPKAHNLKVAGSNPAPASKEKPRRPMAYGARTFRGQPTARRAFPRSDHRSGQPFPRSRVRQRTTTPSGASITRALRSPSGSNFINHQGNFKSSPCGS